MNIEIGAGIKALIGRMESNPDEFFDEAPKWRFMFADRFRDTMTESEKGAIHAALKEVRRKEFEHKVMRTLLDDDLKEQAMSAMERARISGGTLGLSTGTYAGTYTQSTGHSALQIGKETLSEEDLREIKQARMSANIFK
jgi:hypothetical protein